MKGNAAVVIPYYHSNLSEFEQISFQNCLNVLKNYPIILVVPAGMPAENYPLAAGLLYVQVPDVWLDSVASYNRMMLSEEFYQRFIQYEYILIFQLDAFVFSDSLDAFIGSGYDYIGAPWLKGWPYLKNLEKGVWHVGNGGFSLRKVSSFLNVLREQQVNWKEGHEDLFWASRDSEEFHVAPMEIALAFAFEQDVRQCFAMNHNRLPFGCHAWEKYDFDFWRPELEKNGYYILSQTAAQIDKENNYRKPGRHYLEAEGASVVSCLSELSGKKEPLFCIFGTGTKGSECGWLLRHAGILNVKYLDNNPNIWGNRRWGITIESPVCLKEADRENIFIIIAVNLKKNETDIRRQLEAWGYLSNRDVISYHDFTESLISAIQVDKV